MWFLWFLIGKNCNCNQFPPKFEFSGQQLTFRHFLAILVFLAFFEKKIGGFFWKFHFLSILKNLNYLGQKFMENAKNKKFKCDILNNFRIIWVDKSQLKIAKKSTFGEFFEKNWSVTRYINLNLTKIGEKCQNWKS